MCVSDGERAVKLLEERASSCLAAKRSIRCDGFLCAAFIDKAKGLDKWRFSAENRWIL